MLLRKVDSDTGGDRPQGSGSLENAHFSFKFYSGEYADGVNPETLGHSPTKSWVFKTDSRGFIRFTETYRVSGDSFWYDDLNTPSLPAGTLVIQEIKPPVGYKLNSEIFVKKIVPHNSSAISTYVEPIVKEDVLEFRIKKVQNGTLIPIPGAKFKHTRP
ncbi:MAG: hypothetical protein E7C49_13800, partial [Clostridium sp.]|nr:hypothetical protein [Clostridium sp.]